MDVIRIDEGVNNNMMIKMPDAGCAGSASVLRFSLAGCRAVFQEISWSFPAD
jgi:hypothetical protein